MTFGLYALFTLLVLLVFFLWTRRLIIKRLDPERLLNDLNLEVQRMIQDLNATGDQNVSILEDRIETLKALIRRADTQIEEMEGRLREIEEQKLGETDSTETDSTEPAPKEPTFTLPFGHQPEEPNGVPTPPPLDEPVPETTDTGGSSPRDRIVALYKEGMSSEIIAGRMGMAIGEVELIISLAMNRTRS